VETAHAEKKWDVFGCAECGAVEFCASASGGEVWDVVGALFRPAFADDPIDDVLRVADERVEAAIIFEFVIAAEAADAFPGAGRRKARGAVHPGDDDAGVLFACERGDGAGRREVERLGEREHASRHAEAFEFVLAALVSADGGSLADAGAPEGAGKPDEVRLRAAIGGRAEHLDQAHAGKAGAVIVVAET